MSLRSRVRCLERRRGHGRELPVLVIGDAPAPEGALTHRIRITLDAGGFDSQEEATDGLARLWHQVGGGEPMVAHSMRGEVLARWRPGDAPPPAPKPEPTPAAEVATIPDEADLSPEERRKLRAWFAYTVPVLREQARRRGIEGYEFMKRDELIAELTLHQPQEEEEHREGE